MFFIGLFGLVPLQFFKVGDIPLLFVYLNHVITISTLSEIYHYLPFQHVSQIFWTKLSPILFRSLVHPRTGATYVAIAKLAAWANTAVAARRALDLGARSRRGARDLAGARSAKGGRRGRGNLVQNI
jgi:hypothetical protein